MTREELIERICPTDCTDKCFEGNISCDICDNITGLMLDEYEKQIEEEAYKRGYKDALDKYEKKETQLQMWRRSGHP